MVRVEMDPGVSIGRHTHPGDELGYVQLGEVEMFVEGDEPRRLSTGEAFIVTAGKIHGARNIGKNTASLIVTYVVEKGKPLAIPAK
jgi:quercetin dioxygenase-like cupin family protein